MEYVSPIAAVLLEMGLGDLDALEAALRVALDDRMPPIKMQTKIIATPPPIPIGTGSENTTVLSIPNAISTTASAGNPQTMTASTAKGRTLSPPKRSARKSGSV